VGTDTSVTGGLVAAASLLAVNFAVATARVRLPFLRRTMEGTPTLLVSHGQFVSAHLKKEELDEDDVLMAMREHGVADLSQVEMAVLEVDGSISIFGRIARIEVIPSVRVHRRDPPKRPVCIDIHGVGGAARARPSRSRARAQPQPKPLRFTDRPAGGAVAAVAVTTRPRPTALQVALPAAAARARGPPRRRRRPPVRLHRGRRANRSTGAARHRARRGSGVAW